MRTAGAHESIACDQMHEKRHLCLELDSNAEPIAGRLLTADGTTREFVGWLELTQVLEAETTRPEPPSPPGKDH